ncbi:MAG: hypothetical protein AB1726_12705 [Planctomycetota bacterium]
MSSEPEEKPFSESHLDSPEYRMRLKRKLNTLIAVLEVACAKVRRSLNHPEADTERLQRIHKNLKDTLQVCLRAKRALDRCEALPQGLPSSLTRDLAPAPQPEGEARGSRSIEMSSPEEEERFRRLGPLDPAEIRTVDLDDLCRRLLN